MSVHSLLSHLGVRAVAGGEHRHVRAGWTGVDCPWCGTVGKYHLGIPDSGHVAVCWLCGPRSLTKYIREVSGRPWDECRRLAASASGEEVVGPKKERTGRREPIVPSRLGPVEGAYRRYLRRRGFDPELITDVWGLKSTGPFGPLAWRLWVPIRDAGGRLASWTTRAIGRGTKYVHARPEQERIPVKSLLYGEDLVPGRTVVVVEGPTDVWRIGPGAVATFGVNATADQIERLRKYPRRIILYDADRAGRRAGERLYRRLGAGPGEDTILAEPDAADPGEASPKEILRLRRFAFS